MAFKQSGIRPSNASASGSAAAAPAPTALADYSAALVEAAWLAVLVLVPLFFNPYSGQVFEPEKVALLRALAWLAAAAAGLHLLERHAPGRGAGTALRRVAALPLAWPVLAVLATLALSSTLSLQPSRSVFGSLARQQGLLTTVAMAVMFVAVAACLRGRQQLQRAVDAMVLASVPVALYALAQRAGLDPLVWDEAVADRAISSLGNPIFLAAFLAMVSFPTLASVLERAQDWRRQVKGWRPLLAVLTRVAVLALQLAAMVASESRGPVLAWGVALSLFALLRLRALTPYWKRWLLPLLAIVAGTVLLALVSARSPLDPQALDRGAAVARALNFEQGSGRARTLIWEGAAQLALGREPILLADGRPEPRARLRPWLGYGPETLPLAFHQVYPPELAYLDSRTDVPDRAHSDVLDAWLTTGGLGFVAQQALFIGAFGLALSLLGLGAGRRGALLGVLAMLGGGLGLAGAAGFWGGPAFAGPAWALGVAGGLFLAALLPTRPGTDPPSALAPGSGLPVLATALLCGLLAHYLETGLTGIAVTATRSLAWILIGLLVALQLRFRTGTPDSEQARDAGAASRHPAVSLGVLLALAWACLGFAFLGNQQVQPDAPSLRAFASAWSLMADALTASATTPVLFAATALAALALSVASGAPGGQGGGSPARSWARWVGVALAASLLCAWGQAATLARVGREALLAWSGDVDAATSALQAQAHSIAALPAWLFFWLAMGVFALAWALVPRRPEGGRRIATPAGVALALVLAPALLAGVAHTLRAVRADTLIEQASSLPAIGAWEAMARIQQDAIALQPSQDRYPAWLADTLLQRAAADEAGREASLRQAEAALRVAQRGAPLDPDHPASLGRLHHFWALKSADPVRRQEQLAASASAYARATRLSPYRAQLWNEAARVQMDDYRAAMAEGQSGQAVRALGRARRFLGRSLELDGQYDRSFLVVAELALLDGNSAAAAAAFRRALYHNPALAEAWRGLARIHRRDPGLARLEETARSKLARHPDLLEAQRVLVTEIHLPAGRLAEAIAAQRRVVALSSGVAVVALEQLSLAVLLAESGARDEARALARTSLAALPPAQQADARALIESLGTQP